MEQCYDAISARCSGAVMFETRRRGSDKKSPAPKVLLARDNGESPLVDGCDNEIATDYIDLRAAEPAVAIYELHSQDPAVTLNPGGRSPFGLQNWQASPGHRNRSPLQLPTVCRYAARTPSARPGRSDSHPVGLSRWSCPSCRTHEARKATTKREHRQ